MSSAAQDEYDELFRNKDRRTAHPEDSQSSDNEQQRRSPSGSPPARRPALRSGANSSYSSPQQSQPKSRTFVPSQKSYSNTGPKGVIADAQSFEHARRTHRASVSHQNLADPSATQPYSENLAANDGGGPPQLAALNLHDDDDDDEDADDEGGFMAQWRQERLRQLNGAKGAQQAGAERSRAGAYGGLIAVDGEGYLEAVDGSPRDTVVVVFIYDDRSEVSSMVEECVRQLARKHRTARFVKLHFEDAEMEPAGVPAVLAYKAGDKFAGLVPVVDEIPDDADLSWQTLEVLFQSSGLSLQHLAAEMNEDIETNGTEATSYTLASRKRSARTPLSGVRSKYPRLKAPITRKILQKSALSANLASTPSTAGTELAEIRERNSSREYSISSPDPYIGRPVRHSAIVSAAITFNILEARRIEELEYEKDNEASNIEGDTEDGTSTIESVDEYRDSEMDTFYSGDDTSMIDSVDEYPDSEMGTIYSENAAEMEIPERYATECSDRESSRSEESSQPDRHGSPEQPPLTEPDSFDRSGVLDKEAVLTSYHSQPPSPSNAQEHNREAFTSDIGYLAHLVSVADRRLKSSEDARARLEADYKNQSQSFIYEYSRLENEMAALQTRAQLLEHTNHEMTSTQEDSEDTRLSREELVDAPDQANEVKAAWDLCEALICDVETEMKKLREHLDTAQRAGTEAREAAAAAGRRASRQIASLRRRAEEAEEREAVMRQHADVFKAVMDWSTLLNAMGRADVLVALNRI
ncbi:hypothetical protein MBLNU459_g8191t1 [Dothideomycetes sp. NU459]